MGNELHLARGTFFIAPDAIFSMPDTLSKDALIIYLCLNHHADKQNKAFPAYKLLMKECRIKSEKAISAALKDLISHGLVNKEVRTRTKKGRGSSIYTIFEPSCNTLDTSNTEVSKKGVTSDTEVTVTSDTEVTVTSNTEVEPYTLSFNQTHTINQTQLNSTLPAEPEAKERVKLSLSSTTREPQEEKPTAKKKREKNEVIAEVKAQIDYPVLQHDFPNEPILDEILSVLVAGIRSTRDYWTISGEHEPTEEVRERFLKRNMFDVSGLIRQYKTSTKKIEHPRAYITACLFHLKEGENVQFRSQYNAGEINQQTQAKKEKAAKFEEMEREYIERTFPSAQGGADGRP